MIKISFTNPAVKITSAVKRVIAEVEVSDAGTAIAFEDDISVKILVANSDISHLGFIKGSKVTIEPLSYPEDTFSMELLPEKKAKAPKLTKPNNSSPSGGMTIQNGWNI